MIFDYDTAPDPRPVLGLIALQSDETIEDDLRRLIPATAKLLVSRVASGTEVTRDTLAEMEHHLTQAAGLFPRGLRFDMVGYGCTSGTAQIGAETIASRIRGGTEAAQVTEPVSALIAACRALGIRRLGFLSPYIAEVSDRLRDVLRQAGIDTPVFGSFAEANEARVVRISGQSVTQAAIHLGTSAPIDGLFLSCTNLRTLDVIGDLETRLNMPVLSSNLVLAWHILHKTGLVQDTATPSDILAK